MNNWEEYKNLLFYDEQTELMVDISQIQFPKDFFNSMDRKIKDALIKMDNLEKGEIANLDEGRMVGHYWLRTPELAPSSEITDKINSTVNSIKQFANKVYTGEITGERGRKFNKALVVGIGGSSLGPRFISDALGNLNDKTKLLFIDNTDPDGMDRVLTSIKAEIDRTLVIVISKSGGTIETRNGTEEIREFYIKNKLDFKKYAVSITQEGSKLDRAAKTEGWLASFPLWDWVGGRTSVLSAVGLLPLALQGINIDKLLEGASKCDKLTRNKDIMNNPSALLALSWYAVTGGKGGSQMVMLPYKDRLCLFANYIQQLVMESLGKEHDLDGNTVNQGIAVFGNKGSTDQHSYVQQLLAGPNNFFVTFIEVLKDREGQSVIVGENSTSGDYLKAFMLGTRKALTKREKRSVTITIKKLTEVEIGILIALFERTVGIYASLINVNAYDQPAVEMSKKGANEVISLKNHILDFLKKNKGKKYTVDELSKELENNQNNKEVIFKMLLHLSANSQYGVKAEKKGDIFSTQYGI